MNVKVNLTGDVVEDEQFRQNVTILYQGDNPPDITSYPGAWVPDFATAGYLLDISDKLAAWPDWKAHFYQVLRDRAKQADGKYYSMPRHGTVIELFIRKDVLEQNGISTDAAQLVAGADRSADGAARQDEAAGDHDPGRQDLGRRDLRRGVHPHLQRDRRQALRRRHQQVDRQEPGPDRRVQLLQHAPEGRAAAVQGAARSAALGADQVRRLHRHHGRRQGIPVAPPITTQGSWGWVYDWGPAPTGARPIPGHLRRQGRHVGLPEQGANDNFVWAAEDWMWTISAKSKHPDEAFALLKCLNTGAPLAMDVAAVGNLAPRDDIRDIAPYKDKPYLIKMEELLTVRPDLQGPGRDRQDPAGRRRRHRADPAQQDGRRPSGQVLHRSSHRTARSRRGRVAVSSILDSRPSTRPLPPAAGSMALALASGVR